MKRFPMVIGGLWMGAAAIAPALAQNEEIIVQGHQGRSVDNAPSASMPVSYADLDLGTPDGQNMLERRIRHTARYLCDRLGESGSGDALAPSCERTAISDAMDRIGTIEQDAAPRDTAWIRPAPWRTPYPAAWDSDGYDDGGYDGR